MAMAMAMAKATWFHLVFISASVFSANATIETASNVTNNPADQLVATLNQNRTAHKTSPLFNNPGLACIALQYIKAYQGNCAAVGGHTPQKPAESEFTDTFAPTCGIKASTLAAITGRLLGCQSKYVSPAIAFSDILVENNKSFEILYGNSHAEVGAAVSGSDGGAPYFWCVLFSNGTSNSSFVFEAGVAKLIRPGCYSGANDECSRATHDSLSSSSLWFFSAIGIMYAIGL